MNMIGSMKGCFSRCIVRTLDLIAKESRRMNASIGETLRRLRMNKGLSQQNLADALHVDRSTVTKWENGRRLPDTIMLVRLSECLGMDLASLMNAASAPKERPRVLIVDDERIILNGGIAILKQAMPGAVVQGCTIPTAALDYAHEHPIALALLDIELGRTSGLELCRQILALRPRTNVVFLTAYREYSFDAWASGACGFLLKPLTLEAVLAQLERLRYPIGGLVHA